MNANEDTKAAYRRALNVKNRADRTIDGYEWWIDDLADWNHGEDVTVLEKKHMEEYFIDLLEVLKDTSVAVAFRSLRAFFNWCVKEEIIEVSPMARMEMHTIEKRSQDLATDEELRALMKACSGTSFEDRRDLAIIRLFCEVGTPRRAEMAGILLENLEMRANNVTFLGKGALWRTIPFGVKTGQALDRYLRVRTRHSCAGSPKLWLSKRGTLTDWGIRQVLVRRCKQAGIRLLKPHQLRHTSYHNARMNGLEVDDAEVLFGWIPGTKMHTVYGATAREVRAQKAAKKLSIADRL